MAIFELSFDVRKIAKKMKLKFRFYHLSSLSDAVFRLSFAPDDKHRLACCSKDSNLSVFDLGAYPPYLNKTLSGHNGAVR